MRKHPAFAIGKMPQADWNFTFRFPKLIVETEKLDQPEHPKKNTQAATSLDFADAKVTDSLTGFDMWSGHLETKSGHTFVVTREGEKITAVGWSAGSQIEYSCDRKRSCLIENGSEAVHARLAR